MRIHLFLCSSALKVEGELWVTPSLPLTVVRADAATAEGGGIIWAIPDEVIDYPGGISLALRSFIDTSSILLSDGNEFLEPPKLGYVKHHRRVPILTNHSELGVGYAVYPSSSNDAGADLRVYHFCVDTPCNSSCWLHDSVKRMYIP